MAVRIYGNRQIKTLPGQDTRPTASRVREAVFNIWQGSIEGCRWLDVCAGTGAMGAEALCRGASHVVGVEKSSRACVVIRQNWQMLAKADQTFQVFQGDVRTQLPRLEGQSFDLIYIDPPYASGLYTPVLNIIAQAGLLALQGELAIEHDANYSPVEHIHPRKQTSERDSPEKGQVLQICRQKVYGSTALTFYEPTP